MRSGYTEFYMNMELIPNRNSTDAVSRVFVGLQYFVDNISITTDLTLNRFFRTMFRSKEPSKINNIMNNIYSMVDNAKELFDNLYIGKVYSTDVSDEYSNLNIYPKLIFKIVGDVDYLLRYMPNYSSMYVIKEHLVNCTLHVLEGFRSRFIDIAHEGGMWGLYNTSFELMVDIPGDAQCLGDFMTYFSKRSITQQPTQEGYSGIPEALSFGTTEPQFSTNIGVREDILQVLHSIQIKQQNMVREIDVLQEQLRQSMGEIDNLINTITGNI